MWRCRSGYSILCSQFCLAKPMLYAEGPDTDADGCGIASIGERDVATPAAPTRSGELD